MPPDDPPDDLKAFLPTTEDFARALDREAADARTEASLRKAAQNANLANAVAALSEPVAEPQPRPAQASERAEYNPAKTVPPRTRRDTLEVVQKVEVVSELLDPRHRPTARIARAAVVAGAPEADLSAATPSTPPAPGVTHEAAPINEEARKRYLVPLLLLVAAVVAAVLILANRSGSEPAAAASSAETAAAPTATASPPSPPATVLPMPVEPEPTAEPAPSAEATPASSPSVTKSIRKNPRTNTTVKPVESGPPKAVD